jgi:catechol 2,3-dioxygenase-like lactoylglutathione lyase family enzyme
MYYGHESWIALVVFGGMFALRYLTSQRRRGGQRGRPGPQSPFVGPGRPGPDSGSADGPPVGPPAASPTSQANGSTGMAPGWFRDPFVRHEQRYWSGREWTDHVLDDGVPATDPPPSGRGGREDA